MLGHKILFDYAMAEVTHPPAKTVKRSNVRETQRRRGEEERRPALAA